MHIIPSPLHQKAAQRDSSYFPKSLHHLKNRCVEWLSSQTPKYLAEAATIAFVEILSQSMSVATVGKLANRIALFQVENELKKINFGMGLLTSLILTPIKEEIFFREIIQNLCLKRIPQIVLKRTAPEKAACLDTRTGKIARIMITSMLYTALSGILLSRQVNQIAPYDFKLTSFVIKALFMHILFNYQFQSGTIYESKKGILGSIAKQVHLKCYLTLGSMLLNVPIIKTGCFYVLNLTRLPEPIQRGAFSCK